MKRKFTWIILLVLTASLFVGCGSPPSYTVTFDLNGGELISGELVQTVTEGAAAVSPEAAMEQMALTWDKAFDAVTGDMTVTAQWTRVPMDTVELATYVQERTVTVDVECIDGSYSTGSGFFIDNHGTVVTNFHVIEGAQKISIRLDNGEEYRVSNVLCFDHLHDLAVLSSRCRKSPYLNFAERDARTGERVYAVGTALGILPGTFTQGMVSHDNRTFGLVDYLQMDTAISSGNSGGPLVNVYGEVVGINTASYVDGQSLNLAIKPHELDRMKNNKNQDYTVTEFKNWYIKNSEMSYCVMDEDGYFYPSLVKNYQSVTGIDCITSILYDSARDRYVYKDGYVENCECYYYEYSESQYKKYEDYLIRVGFEYDGMHEYTDGISHFYYNHTSLISLELHIANDPVGLYIYPTTY